MRALTFPALLSLLLVSGTACKKRGEGNPVATVEEQPELESTVSMADASAVRQIGPGFHQLEGGAWRWTRRSFQVTLRPPEGSEERGAVLEMNCSLPRAVAARLGRIRVSARVGETALAPVSVSGEGNHVLRQRVPGAPLNRDEVTVEFTLDKVVPAGALDARELGLVVSQIGLVAQ